MTNIIDDSYSPFMKSDTEWYYDLKHNAVVEKRIDGTNITHIYPSGGKNFLMNDILNKFNEVDKGPMAKKDS